ncbi:MAG: thioredoxin domain-containing protein [Chloroflexi bacterium]|nr:thioredoxin domain-containing protein [Chloroflexota bacterium]
MNRLQHETSPYLLQHADNPVDWFPWGPEAFEKARAEDKPVLLSIGYSACHWCHVMAHESFEDDDTALLMNDLFVNIKVDREERPDVDDIYMQATLIFTQGHGGWPMTVFMTPDGRPFHAGTYYPPEPRHGMPSFKQILVAAAQTYQTKRDQLEESASKIAELLQSNMGAPVQKTGIELDADLLAHAANGLIMRADKIHGGLHSGQPKFPSPMNLEFLLRYYTTSGDARFLDVVTFTLRKMAQGGIYDQIGGGFHRYSVDNRWLVPHFEKMLYDNAQLARVYLHAYQLTGDACFADICRDILAYVTREMRDPSGGFYSTQDADSEGEEGKFFIWTPEEMRTVLEGHFDEFQIAAYLDLYDITSDGNFEGHSIPNRPYDLRAIAERHGMEPAALEDVAEMARPILFAHREHRVKPGRDEKMLAAWNGMMLAAFAEAARVLDERDYRDIAVKNAEFILSALTTEDGRLFRTHKRHGDGGESKLNGYLEDYANVVDGLLELYQTAFDTHWFTEAQRLADHALEHFFDGEAFYDTSDDHEVLIARPRSLQDTATPTGSNLMALNLLKLAAYTGGRRYEDAALGVFRQIDAAMREYPSAFGTALAGVHLLVHRPFEVAIIGPANDPQTEALLDAVRQPYYPYVIAAWSSDDVGDDSTPMLLAHRKMQNGAPTAYVCQNFVCAAPVDTVEELRPLLRGRT